MDRVDQTRPLTTALLCFQMSEDVAIALNSQLSCDIAGLLADGLTEPSDVLVALRKRSTWRDAGFTLDAVTRAMRALQRDTRDAAKRLVHARSLETMADVLDNGEPKDKIQVLAKWGPAVNDDGDRGGLTIIVGGNAQVQVNVGAPPQVVVGASLTKSE